MISYTNEKRNALKSPKNGHSWQKGIRAAFHNVSRILGLTYPRYIKYVFDGKDTKKTAAFHNGAALLNLILLLCQSNANIIKKPPHFTTGRFWGYKSYV